MKLKINIAKPESGWTNIFLNHGNYSLNFNASNIPNNCIDDLIEAIILIQDGITSKVIFHLEPEWYSFSFKKLNANYYLEINTNTKDKVEQIYTITGTFKEVILPFYRALRKLLTFRWEKTDWANLNTNKIFKLENKSKLIKVK